MRKFCISLNLYHYFSGVVVAEEVKKRKAPDVECITLTDSEDESQPPPSKKAYTGSSNQSAGSESKSGLGSAVKCDGNGTVPSSNSTGGSGETEKGDSSIIVLDE